MIDLVVLLGTDMISGAIGWAFGSIEGFGTVITVLLLGRHVKHGAKIGVGLNWLGWFLIGLAVLSAIGVVDLNPGALRGILGSIKGLIPI